eukprot:GHVS01032811.1.p1 GENE.GHVS01032811.1~~GHVS01032811.1.p1  ORF type:complete len:116 (-),score=1.93 GHVS01032811.1:50-397(-)
MCMYIHVHVHTFVCMSWERTQIRKKQIQNCPNAYQYYSPIFKGIVFTSDGRRFVGRLGVVLKIRCVICRLNRRLEWHVHLSFSELHPIEVGEPPVLLDIVSAVAQIAKASGQVWG